MGVQSTAARGTEHPFVCNGGDWLLQENVFDSAVRNAYNAIHQPAEIALLWAPVEGAARHGV